MKNKEKKSLIYIDMFYPYDYKGETFLATEIDFMEKMGIKNIEKYILPIWADWNKEKVVDLKDFVVIKDMGIYSKSKKIKWCLYSLLDKTFYIEILNLLESKRVSLKNIIKALAFIAQGNYLSFKLESYIKENIEKESEIILYSYWMHLQSYVAVKIKMRLQGLYNICAISRCHRFDVYEYAANGYIPCRQFILEGLNKVYSISKDAVDYMIKKYKFDYSKLKISRLGTEDKGINISPKEETLKIVSCSWMRAVKRNSMIFDAIKDLDFPIEWTHIGDGDEYELIEMNIKKLKNKNIQCKLLGRMNNMEVIDFYKNYDFNVFINVSKSEGVPVSIMEAMAFGKAIIATDVGGTKEIVYSGKNGFLLPEDLDAKYLRKYIELFHNLSEDKYIEMCKCSRNIWENFSNASKNYKEFNKEIISQN